jgi:hypothetical protein
MENIRSFRELKVWQKAMSVVTMASQPEKWVIRK